jgi:hypothetical protein
MGLMIEQMQEYVRNGLGVGHARRRPVTVDAGQRSVVVRVDHADEPIILSYARSGKLGPIFEQDGIQSAGMVALPGQPFEPDTIRQQQMVQSAMHTGEEHADVQPVGLIRQIECGGVQAGVSPLVIGSKLLKYTFCHQFGPDSRTSV